MLQVIEYVGEIIRQKVADVREKRYERMGIGGCYMVSQIGIVDYASPSLQASILRCVLCPHLCFSFLFVWLFAYLPHECVCLFGLCVFVWVPSML